MDKVAQEAVQQVIEKAYIEGIHGSQDEEIAKSGFHSEFAMLVLKENTIEKVSVKQWLERIKTMKVNNPALWGAKTIPTFGFIDISDVAAVAKLEVYKGNTHFSTDYMLLYKFEEGWRIVSKIFSIPR